jgi:uncharacterized protein YndB with AHSA1/START domain
LRRDLQFELTYPHPPEKVWSALTDPQAIAQWLMKSDFEARVGHKFQFKVEPPPRGWSGVVDCEVLEVERPRRLVYTWCSGKLNTTVCWNLHARKRLALKDSYAEHSRVAGALERRGSGPRCA